MKNLLIISCGGSKPEPNPQNVQNTNIQTCDGGNCDYIDVDVDIDGDGNTVQNAINDAIENALGDVPGEEIALGDEEEITPEEEIVESFVFEETESYSHDLESMGAREEQRKLNKIARNISFDYGLSLDRSNDIAKLMFNYKKMTNNRSMTNADLNAISEQLLGASVDDMNDMLQRQIQGDENAYNDFIDRAAYINGTTPEQMNAIIESIL